MLPRVFIGGTGRSGTTILYKAIGCHQAIYSLGKEMRFIVDPDGLINLVEALTSRYSPVHAQEALFRFERLMCFDLVYPGRPPFLGSNLAELIGEDYYWKRLGDFCNQLVELEYSVPVSQQPKRYRGYVRDNRIIRLKNRIKRLFKNPAMPYRITFNWPRSKMRLVKYYSDRSELINLAAAFIDDIFLHAAYQEGKKTWCEKTPQNVFHVNFLWELFPDSVFVHIKRDPRGVVQSVINQSWGPNTVNDVCIYLKSMYDRWFEIKKEVDLDQYRYLEMRLEDLAADPSGELERFALFSDLENCFTDIPDIQIEKVNYWQKSLSSAEIQTVNNTLGSYIERLGYTV